MIYSVRFQEGIERETRRIAARELKQITAAIRRYAETGYGDVKALKGKPGQHRLRVGDYRVLFALDSSSAELVVQRIAHRREVYRD